MVNPMTNEESIALLNKCVADRQGQDSFRVKIHRLGRGNTMPELVLIVDNVSVREIANPEQWLGRLLGGGPIYNLHCYHMADTTLPAGQRLQYNVTGQPKPFCDFSALNSPTYDGPRNINFPEPEKAGLGTSYSMPAPAGSLSSVPQSQMPGGNSLPGPAFPSGGQQQIVDSNAVERAALAADRAAFAQRERDMQARLHQMELDSIRREQIAAMAALEAKIAARPSVDHKTDIAGIVTAIAGALAPIVGAMMTAGQQQRMDMFKMQQDAAIQQQNMIAKMMERPGIDPQLQAAQDKLFAVLEKSMNSEGPNVKMLTTVSEAMGGVMGLYGDAIKMLTDLNTGEKEPVGMMVVKELVKGVNAIAQASQAAPRRIPQMPPQRQQAQVQVHPGQNGAHPQQAQFNGFPPQGQVAAGPVGGNPRIVDEIEQAIRKMTAPAQVAQMFVKALNDPYMEAELNQHGRDPTALFTARLGQWAAERPEHGQYILQGLLPALNEALTNAGIKFIEGPSATPVAPQVAQADDEGEESDDEGDEEESDEEGGDEEVDEEGEGADA